MRFTQVLNNFADRIATTLPNILGALILLLIGWLIARGIRTLIIKLLDRSSWDQKIFKKPLGANRSIGNLLYYLLMIIVFLIVLETLGISSVLTPLETMLDSFFAFIPHLVAAIIIGLVGYFLAKIVSDLIGLAGDPLNRLIAKTGFKDTGKIIKVIKTLVFIMIFFPLLISAIHALQIESIADPLDMILSRFISMIGNIIIAAAVLLIFIYGGKYLTKFLGGLLKDLGLDNIAEKIQLQNIIGPNRSFSKVIAGVLYFFLVFFGIITALEILELPVLNSVMNTILDVTGSIAFGVVILLIGNFIAVMIYNAMLRSDKNRFIASVVKYATLGIFLGIAFRAMGIANSIVELAFGLTLGSLAVVIALAYGLGGREAAGEHFREIIQKFKGNNKENKNDMGNDPLKP